MVTVKQAKAIAERYQKAVELVEAGKVFPVYGYAGHYAVVNGDGQAYLVRLDDQLQNCTCTCPDFQYRARKLDIPCKHVLAAQLFAERQPQQPDDGGRGAKPRRRYQCDRCGAVEESDDDLTGTRCRRCLLLHPLEPRGLFQPLDEPEAEPEPARCELCGSELEQAIAALA